MRAIALQLCTAAVLVACGGGVSGPSESSLVGAWHATKMEYVSKAGAGQVELVIQGWAAVLTLDADRTGTLTVTPATLPAWSWTGAWEVDGDLFRIAGQGADIALSEGSLRLNGFDGGYDFDADGTPEPAKINFVMVQ